MKNKKTIIITVIAVLFVAVAVLLTVLLWPKKTNKQLYTDAVKESFGFVTERDGYAAEKIATLQDVLTNKIIKVIIEDKAGDFGKIELYSSDGTFYGILKNVVNGKNVVADAFFSDNKLYFKIDDVLNDYYYITADDLEYNGNFNLPLDSLDGLDLDFDLNVQKLVDYLIDSLLSSVNNKNVEKDSSSLTINNKKYDTERLSYTYTGEDLYNALKEFVEEIKDDDELYSQLSKLYSSMGENNYSFDEVLNQLVKELEDLKQTGELFTYTVYTKGGDVLSTQITTPMLPVSLVYNSVEDEFYEFYVDSMGKKYIDCTAVVDGDTTKFNVLVQDEKIADGELKKVKDGFTLVLNIKGSSDVPVNGKLEAEFESTGDYSFEGTVKYNFKSEGETVSGEFDIEAEEVDSMPKVNISNAKPYEEMSNSEKQAMESLGFDF
jgi:hypothetical protein